MYQVTICDPKLESQRDLVASKRNIKELDAALSADELYRSLE